MATSGESPPVPAIPGLPPGATVRYVHGPPPCRPRATAAPWGLDPRARIFLCVGLLATVVIKLVSDAAWTNLAPQAGRQASMQRTLDMLLAPGRGILAADESVATMGHRFEQVGLPNNRSLRAAWRHVVLTTPGLEAYVSGVILSEETLLQWEDEGTEGVGEAAGEGHVGAAGGNGTESAEGAAEATQRGLQEQERPGGQQPGGGPREGLEGQEAGEAQQEQSLRRQRRRYRQRLVRQLFARGIQVGIKVDLGTEPLPGGAPGEVQTRGLQGLAQRCKRYKALGATFSKWRAVLHTEPQAAATAAETAGGQGGGQHAGEGDALRAPAAPLLPSDEALRRNARDLAEFAAVSQAAGLVPIVEPEVLLPQHQQPFPSGTMGDSSGSDSAALPSASASATRRVLSAVAAALAAHPGVSPHLLIVKPNMALLTATTRGVAAAASPPPQAAMALEGERREGMDVAEGGTAAVEAVAAGTAGAEAAAAETWAALQVLRQGLPMLPGVAFLSGGQGARQAATNLLHINLLGARQQQQQQQEEAQRGQQPAEEQQRAEEKQQEERRQAREAGSGPASQGGLGPISREASEGGRQARGFVTTFSFGRALMQSALELWAAELRAGQGRGAQAGQQDEQGRVEDWQQECEGRPEECCLREEGGSSGSESGSSGSESGSSGSESGSSGSGGGSSGGEGGSSGSEGLAGRVQAELLKWCRASSRAVQGLPLLEQGDEEQ